MAILVIASLLLIPQQNALELGVKEMFPIATFSLCSPSDFLNCHRCATPLAQPAQYVLRLRDVGGCSRWRRQSSCDRSVSRAGDPRAMLFGRSGLAGNQCMGSGHGLADERSGQQ
jgi:hypothetical protein